MKGDNVVDDRLTELNRRLVRLSFLNESTSFDMVRESLASD